MTEAASRAALRGTRCSRQASKSSLLRSSMHPSAVRGMPSMCEGSGVLAERSAGVVALLRRAAPTVEPLANAGVDGIARRPRLERRTGGSTMTPGGWKVESEGVEVLAVRRTRSEPQVPPKPVGTVPLLPGTRAERASSAASGMSGPAAFQKQRSAAGVTCRQHGGASLNYPIIQNAVIILHYPIIQNAVITLPHHTKRRHYTTPPHGLRSPLVFNHVFDPPRGGYRARERSHTLHWLRTHHPLPPVRQCRGPQGGHKRHGCPHAFTD